MWHNRIFTLRVIGALRASCYNVRTVNKNFRDQFAFEKLMQRSIFHSCVNSKSKQRQCILDSFLSSFFVVLLLFQILLLFFFIFFFFISFPSPSSSTSSPSSSFPYSSSSKSSASYPSQSSFSLGSSGPPVTHSAYLTTDTNKQWITNIYVTSNTGQTDSYRIKLTYII